MSASRCLCTVILMSLGGAFCLAQPAQPATAPASRPALPKEVMQRIEAQFPDREPTEAEMTKRMENIVSLGEKAEKDYPQANLTDVRLAMLQAASWLAGQKVQDAYRKKVVAIAERTLNSDASIDVKEVADFFMVRAKVLPEEKPVEPDKAQPEIRALVKRYAGTEAEKSAMVHGVILARRTSNQKLSDELLKDMETRFWGDPKIKAFLRSLGRGPSVGKPFEAALTRLDGSKLKLPDDLKGKVLVIDFWATWCPPCVEEVPHMKEVHEKYQAKGVEFVGISLDTSKEKLEAFIKTNGLNWTQTFSGKGWDDPTAKKYGVTGIPSIWVVGVDGKVVSDNARNDLERTIEKALEAAKEGKKN